ncbi:C39 family peptidase [Plantactinospora sp. WMMC1484]|uniref:C39 family peptidase n=1 Tax=Plantactinospora sp. WMMC1484 TaxID=3404122 RepID=UPI003BF4A163
MTFVSRWLPAITETPIRRTALGIAGLAVAGGAIAAPAIAADTPTPMSPTSAAVTTDVRDIDKGSPSKVLDYQYKAQENGYYCAPAATRIALTAQGHAPTQDEVAGKLGTTEAGTNSAEDTTRVLNTTGGKGYRTVAIPDPTVTPEQMDRLQVDIVRALDAKRPVVMNIKGTGTDLDGMSHSYAGGHYLTVVGYDDHGRKVKIADPANPDQAEYWMSTIALANWAAERGYSA